MISFKVSSKDEVTKISKIAARAVALAAEQNHGQDWPGNGSAPCASPKAIGITRR